MHVSIKDYDDDDAILTCRNGLAFQETLADGHINFTAQKVALLVQERGRYDRRGQKIDLKRTKETY